MISIVNILVLCTSLSVIFFIVSTYQFFKSVLSDERTKDETLMWCLFMVMSYGLRWTFYHAWLTIEILMK